MQLTKGVQVARPEVKEQPSTEIEQTNANRGELSNNRNVSNAKPVDEEEMKDNLAGADSSLEKPAKQEK